MYAYIACVAAGLVPGIAIGYRLVNKSIKDSFEKKLAVLKAEVEAIEVAADRRIVVEIHKVTNRIKSLL